MKRSMLAAAALTSLMCGRALADPPQPDTMTLSHVRPGTDWNKYTAVIVQPVALPANARNATPPDAFPEAGDSYLLSDEDVYALRNTFSKSMHEVLGDNGFTFGEPHAGAQFIQLKDEKPLSRIHDHLGTSAIPRTLPRVAGHMQEWMAACQTGARIG